MRRNNAKRSLDFTVTHSRLFSKWVDSDPVVLRLPFHRGQGCAKPLLWEQVPAEPKLPPKHNTPPEIAPDWLVLCTLRPFDWLFCTLSCDGALRSPDWLDNYLRSPRIGHWQSCEGPRSLIRRAAQPHGLHPEWLRHYLQSASDWVRGASPA